MFQDFCNYAFTLKESISLSDIEQMDNLESINQACNLSGLNKIIQNLPKGLNTHLTRQFDEGGIELSGGSWQKIALARAFFRKGNIIILDEPSSALILNLNILFLINFLNFVIIKAPFLFLIICLI